MLLKEQIETAHLSNNERIIANYLVALGEQVSGYSTRKIAADTYTNPATVISLAHKLGFPGWLQFRDSFVKESRYLRESHVSLDANLPFSSKDSRMDIAGIITQLYVETANDTMFLINDDLLRQAVERLHKADKIYLFATYDLLYCAQELAFKLEYIGRNPVIHIEQEMLFHDAARANGKDCAIILSYSGGTVPLLQAAKILKEGSVPVIAVTSIGNNELAKLSDIVLRVSTHEKDTSKIGNYTSIMSIHLVLDILYSCLFALDYDRNLAYKTGLTKRNGNHKIIDNGIIKEK